MNPIKRLKFNYKLRALKRARSDYHTISDNLVWVEEFVSLNAKYEAYLRNHFSIKYDKILFSNYNNLANLFDAIYNALNINVGQQTTDSNVEYIQRYSITLSHFCRDDNNQKIDINEIYNYINILIIPYFNSAIELYKKGYKTRLNKQNLVLNNIIMFIISII